MAKKRDLPTCTLWVGDTRVSEMTAKEKDEFGRRCVERIGKTLNEYFSFHPEEYQKIPVVSGN